MKKILCNTLIIIIMLGVFCSGYTQNFSLSKYDRLFCYAETSPATRDDVINSFKAYCRDRNLIINGTLAGSVFEWTGSAIDSALSAIGVDMDYLQAQISKETGGNLGVRWLMTSTGMNIYNRLFAELLQRESLSVGDENVNKTVYSGKSITIDGNNYLIWELTKTAPNGFSIYPLSYILTYGTYINSGSFFNTLYNNGYTNYKYPFCNTSQNIRHEVTSSGDFIRYSIPIYGTYSNSQLVNSGTVFYTVAGQGISVGAYAEYVNNRNVRYAGIAHIGSLTNDYNDPDNIDDTDVTVNTPPDKKILPDPPEDDTTIYDVPSDDPGNNPGGGGGDDPNPDDPIDPYDPTKPFPDTPDNPTPDPGVHGSPGSDGTITLPDFNFDIPDINWSLDGLQHKFPFSLPFDLYNACKLLNAEPQTPELDYTVDLVVYQWPIQMDLHWLDPAARVIRIFELLAFVVGLILITRHLIGG